MKELLDALEGANNVKSIWYDTDRKTWLIEYKSDLKSDEVPSDLLIEFLNNA